MTRATSPFIYGDYWLDKRKDRKANLIWQIASYNGSTRTTDYKTTKKRNLEDAKTVLLSYIENLKTGRRQLTTPKPNDPLAIPVQPSLLRYWEDHGSETISASSIATSLRAFLGFIKKDEVGPGCTFDDMGRRLVERYRAFRMSPHEYAIEWYGKVYTHRSTGVCGATFKGNLADIKAALNHALDEGTVPHLRRIPALPSHLRSPPRTRVLSMEELGAMIAYAENDPPLRNWVLLMLGTGARPVAAAKMVPADQFRMVPPRLDLQPTSDPITKKRNPIVPVIPKLAELLSGHCGRWVEATATLSGLRRRWTRMVNSLALGPDVFTKTIRHTVASNLEWSNALDGHISALLGHTAASTFQNRHKIYSPRFLDSVIGPLSQMWEEAHAEAALWSTKYVVTSTSTGQRIVMDKKKAELLGGKRLIRSYDAVSSHEMRTTRERSKPTFADVWAQTQIIRQSVNVATFHRLRNRA